MKKPCLILIGAGGHARSCIDIIECHGEYQIAGIVGLIREVNTLQLGYKVIAKDDDLPSLSKEYQYAFIAIGQIKTPDHRIRLFQRALDLGFQLPTFISPKAYVSCHAIIGKGSIVMSGAIVNAVAKIGKNCIVNSRALIEHDAKVQDHCHISTGVILNGNALVGEGSFIGSGSVLKEGVSIGQRIIVGMGAVVRKNQVAYSRFLGSDQA